ncbi:hypothetical protein FOA52_005785 [Chlamydomonas sp. UWO 241]|nr:hypothetical protein FOA52_005785 [Chlamydomonas sp. UWO 241]
MLARCPGAGVRPTLHRGAGSVSRPRTVLARADPRVTQGREYREDDGTISTPGSAVGGGEPGAPTDPTMYAGEAPPPRKDNMSKEMKARLRNEYVGMGGSSNKAAMATLAARRPVVFAASMSEVEAPPAEASTSAPASGKSKWVINESELLSSTNYHRAWTYGPMAIMGATFAHSVATADGLGDYASIVVALVAAYVLSDLGTGIYHWSVDNYGDGTTPLVGRQIAAFQGHHQRPWTITQREFANNLHQVFRPFAYPAAFFLVLSPFTPVWCDAFFSSFLFLVCMSQQFHAWAHMKKSQLPGVVVALQDAGVLVSRKAHGAHHRSPFEGNYCIVSGLWNEALDGSGFYRGLEGAVKAVTGVEPRCWHEPEYEMYEEEAGRDATASF